MELTKNESGAMLITFPEAQKRFIGKVEKITSLVQDLAKDLAAEGYELDAPFLQSVLNKGSEALKEKAVQDYRAWAGTVNQPGYLLPQGEKLAADSVPEKLIQNVEDILFNIRVENRTNEFQTEDSVMIPAVQLENFAVTKTGRVKYQGETSEVIKGIPVTNEEFAIAERLSRIVSELRPIEAQGYEVTRIIRRVLGNRYAPAETPPDISPESLVLLFRKPLMKGPTYEDLAGPGKSAERLVLLRIEKEQESR